MENNENNTSHPRRENSNSSELMEAIKSGKVKMRSRRYFLLRDTLAVTSIVIVLLIVVYFASFIIFVLHQSGAWFVPVFGLSGWFALFYALPWVLIALSGLFVIALAFLVKRYPFGYQWPLLYSVLGAFFLVAAVSFFFVQTSFSDALFDSLVPRELLGEYYPGVGLLAPNDIHRGEVIAVTPYGFIMENLSGGETSTIIIASGTDLTFLGGLHVGDNIVIFGDRSATGTIQAVGIEKLTP